MGMEFVNKYYCIAEQRLEDLGWSKGNRAIRQRFVEVGRVLRRRLAIVWSPDDN
ncbi:hypothetical protein Hanom_Chr17g01568941 [Helianthus anomalus]